MATVVTIPVSLTITAPTSPTDVTPASVVTIPISLTVTDPAPPTEPPVNLTPPSLAGTLQIGQVLTVDAGGWAGTPTLSYQWQYETDPGVWTDIPGATGLSYTVAPPVDVGTSVAVVVMAANDAGVTVVRSDPFLVVETPIVPPPPPPPVEEEPPKGPIEGLFYWLKRS
jgi:hypothetical protein